MFKNITVLLTLVFLSLDAALASDNQRPFDDQVAPFSQPAPQAPDYLTLSNSRDAQDLCLPFLEESAFETLNNIFANLAYEETVRLYAIHEDRFVAPLTDILINKGFFGIAQWIVLKKTGLDVFKSAFEAISGKQVSSCDYLGAQAKSNLHQTVLDVLRFKPITGFINRNVVGPQLVAPYVASAVYKADLGRLMQVQIFKRLYDTLVSYEADLIAREKSKIPQYEKQLEEVGKTKSDLSNRYTEIHLRSTQLAKDLAVAETRQKEVLGGIFKESSFYSYYVSRELTPEEKQVVALKDELGKINAESRTYSQNLVACQKEHKTLQEALKDSRELLEDDRSIKKMTPLLSILEEAMVIEGLLSGGSRPLYTLQQLAASCPHIQSGVFGRFVSQHSGKLKPVIDTLAYGGYLYLQAAGVITPVERLKYRLSLQGVQDTVQVTFNKYKTIGEGYAKIANRSFHPTEELSVLESSRHYISKARETNSDIHSMLKALRFYQPILEHVREVKGQATNLGVGLKRAYAPVQIVGNTLMLMPILYVANYLLESGIAGYHVPTGYMPALLVAIFMQMISHFIS